MRTLRGSLNSSHMQTKGLQTWRNWSPTVFQNVQFLMSFVHVWPLKQKVYFISTYYCHKSKQLKVVRKEQRNPEYRPENHYWHCWPLFRVITTLTANEFTTALCIKSSIWMQQKFGKCTKSKHEATGTLPESCKLNPRCWHLASCHIGSQGGYFYDLHAYP